MKPLANWDSLKNGYIFRERTWYTRYHLGLDKMAPAWTPVYAPYDGRVVGSGKTAVQGNYVHYKPNHGNLIMRFMHLIQPGRQVGVVRKGDVIGYIGTTGMSTGNHLHVDISKGAVNIYNIDNFIDPATFNWDWEPATPPTSFVVRVDRTAYVRSQPKTSAPLAGSQILYTSTTFTGVDVVAGDTVSGNNKWVKSIKGNFIWSGNLSY